MEKIRKYLPSLLIGLLLAAGFTFAWNAVWNGTNWAQPGYIITAQQIGENFEFLYQHSVPDGFPVCLGEDKALQWDGNQIVCGTVTGAGGGASCGNVDQVLTGGSAHTVGDCIAAGGTSVDIGNGECLCKMVPNYSTRYNSYSCPSGWTQYNNWTDTTGRTCGSNAECWECYTGQHVFDDRPRETCRYGTWTGGDGGWCTNNTCYATVNYMGCI